MLSGFALLRFATYGNACVRMRPLKLRSRCKAYGPDRGVPLGQPQARMRGRTTQSAARRQSLD